MGIVIVKKGGVSMEIPSFSTARPKKPAQNSVKRKLLRPAGTVFTVKVFNDSAPLDIEQNCLVSCS